MIIENNRQKSATKENVVLPQNLKVGEHSHKSEVLRETEDASS